MGASLVQATTLSDAAQALLPGQWVQLPTTGFNDALLKDGDYNLFQYTEDIIWDPVSKQLLFVGGGHGSNAAFISYGEVSNAWQTRSLPGSYWSTNFSHAYDHSTIIPSLGRFYHRQPGGGDRLEIYDIGSNTWTRSAPLPNGQQCCGAVEWFPELGRIVYVDGDYGVFAYDPATNQWSTLSNTLSSMGPYHVFAEYSPVHKVLLFGGGNGSSAIFRMNASGQITRISPDAPGEMGTTHSIVTLDPNSGNFLVFYSSSNWYEYNPTTNEFRRMSGTAPFGAVFDTVATPVSTFGVTLFAKYNGNSSSVYLYRHSPGTGVVQPSVTFGASPTSVAIQGTSVLTWSTSNADSCTASGGWTGSRATSGTFTTIALASTTTFTLTCSNAAGGSTSRSVTVTVASATPAPTVTFSVNPTTVPLNGSATLSWTTSNATSCTGSGGLSGWAGSKQTSGSQNVGPFVASTTFTLSCTGAGGTTQRNAVVSLLGAPTLTFTALPTSVSSGASSTLTWASTNANSCTASGAWAGNKGTAGTQSTGALTATSAFTLSCSGDGGTVQQTANVTVTGAPPPPPPAPAPTVSLTASSSSVTSGTSSTLSWTTTNATSCVAMDGWSGTKTTSGSQSVTVMTGTTTYTLRCTGTGGSTDDSVNITGTEPNLPPTAQANDSGGGGSLDMWLLLGLAQILAAFRMRRTLVARR
jgi:hypothetical protein